MLKDSSDMVLQALRNLGYMDEDMNSDMQEAMLVFINMPDNQYKLRKQLDALPTLEDTAAEVKEKLRYAFLSHLTDGRWRTAPKDTYVRDHLCKQGFLSSSKATSTDVFLAMAEYSVKHHLPEMKTYNGYVFRIRDSLEQNNTKTGTVEVSL